jgi:hypothetical protein
VTSGRVLYPVNMADLISIADAAADLDGLKQFYIDQPDKQAELAARAVQLHEIVTRAAGAHDVAIYAPDDGPQYLDYDRVKAFFAEKLAGDFAGRGRFESAFFHTVRMCYEQGLRDGGPNKEVSEGENGK